MSTNADGAFDLDLPQEFAKGIYWVGFADLRGRLQCNPYLIVDENEAILIDGGSRPDFSTVMRKVLQTGTKPRQISHLIYHHYDPDLCGSIPNIEALIDSPDLKLVSKQQNNHFIHHYSVRSQVLCIDELGHKLTMRSGRTLRFFPTPYAHAAGAFVTFDELTGVLFTSDLFGATAAEASWQLFADFEKHCCTCTNEPSVNIEETCARIGTPCPWALLFNFHREVMPCNAALRQALSIIETIGAQVIAPQHGSIIRRPDDIATALQRLRSLDVGIDHLLTCSAHKP